MSDVAPPSNGQDPPRLWLPPNPEPRSPVLRGLLYATSGITWSIAATTLATMWENTPFMQAMVSYAGWLIWPVGLAVTLYAVHRAYGYLVGPAPSVDAAIRNGELVPPGATDTAVGADTEAAGDHRDAEQTEPAVPTAPVTVDSATPRTATPTKELRNARVLMLRTLWAATSPDSTSPTDSTVSGAPPSDGTASGADGRGTEVDGCDGDLIVFDTDAIVALYDEVVTAFASGIRVRHGSEYVDLRNALRTNVSVVLSDLVRTGDLRRLQAHRYALQVERKTRHQDARLEFLDDPGSTEEQRRLEDLTRQALEAALPALLRHFADLAEKWASALEHRQHAAAAARWFKDREPTLRTLILRCAPDEYQRTAVAEDIARLADALDRWYVRERLWRPAMVVARRVEELADQAQKPVLRDLSALRSSTVRRLIEGPPPRRAPRGRHRSDEEASRTNLLGRLGERVVVLLPAPLRHPRSPLRHPRGFVRALRRRPEVAPRRHRLAVALHARELHESALAELARLGGPGSSATTGAEEGLRLDEIEKLLQDTWRNLPRAEVGNVVATLINLALVNLYQGRLQSADDRLDLAETMTKQVAAPAQHAHALEIRGVVAWTRGSSRRATSLWYNAWSLYKELDIAHGKERCARHLAGALGTDPSLEKVLLECAAKDPSASRDAQEEPPTWAELVQDIASWRSRDPATDRSTPQPLIAAMSPARERAERPRESDLLRLVVDRFNAWFERLRQR